MVPGWKVRVRASGATGRVLSCVGNVVTVELASSPHGLLCDFEEVDLDPLIAT